MSLFSDIFGGGSQTVTQQANLTQEQRELINRQVELADIQIREIGRQRGIQEDVFSGATDAAQQVEDFIAGQTGQAPTFSALPDTGQPQIPGVTDPGQTALSTPDRRLSSAELSDELVGLQLERLRAGGEATPREAELINQAVEQALASGETDISRFQSQATEQLREELAPQLGLRPGDTPVLDRGGRIAAESALQQGQLVRGLRGQQAESLLNFPLQRTQLLGGLTAQQQGLAEGALQFDVGTIGGLQEQARQFGLGLAESGRQFNTGVGEQARQFGVGLTEQARQTNQSLQEAARQFQSQFQSQLQQSAFNNRLQLAGAQSTAGLGLAGVSTPNIGPAFSGLGSTQTTSGGAGFGEIAGGIGGILTGLGAIGIGSSREIKDIDGMVDEAEVLDALSKLPVGIWNYKGEETKHIGPFAEDFQEAFGVGDGKTISIIDALGVLMAGMKALAKEAAHDAA